MSAKELVIKHMPQRIFVIITLVKNIAAPILGLFSWVAMLQIPEFTAKPIWGVIGAAVIAYLTYLGVRANAKAKVDVVGIESKVKQIEVTESADMGRTGIALEIFDRAMLDAKEARAHFAEQIKEQREHFSTKSTEEHERFFDKLTQTRDHYEEREQRLREEYHARLKEAGRTSDDANTKLYTLKLNLQRVGIDTDDNGNIRLPITFERRKDDTG